MQVKINNGTCLDYHTSIVIASHSTAIIKKERGDSMNMHDCQGLVASLSFYTHKGTIYSADCNIWLS